MAVTLTTSWQEVHVETKWFSSTNWIKYHVDAKVGALNSDGATIPIYTRLRSSVYADGWAAAGYKWSLTYAQHTSSSATWEGSDTWYFGTETILETITPTNIKYDKEGNKTVTLTAICQNNYHTAVSTTFTVDVALPTAPTYYLDCGGILDGTSSGNTSGYGTFNVNINGTRVGTGVTDWYQKYIPTTTYSVDGISATTGHTYAGVSGSLSGTIGKAHTYVNLKFNTNSYTITYNLNGGTNASGNPTSGRYNTTVTINNPTRTGYTFNGWSCSGGTLSGTSLKIGTSNVTLTANWTIKTHTNAINHYAAGFVNGEGNAGGNRQFISLGQTTFKAQYGSTITYDSSKFTTIPNGFQFSAMGGSSFASEWLGYPLGQQFTQPDKGCTMQFDYAPIPYTITYSLDGGTNNSANPTSYNVLYGVTFANPTKKGYTFTGWKMDGAIVTGINPGLNAQFADSTALYSGVASRTTGNKTVTATWQANTYKVNYILDGGTNHPDNPTECVYEREYTLYPPTKAGYKFLGWSVADCNVWNGNKLYVEDKDATLYARWEKLQATTKVKVNGAWVTGNLFVKKDGAWVEAQKLYIKKDGSWKEAI